MGEEVAEEEDVNRDRVLVKCCHFSLFTHDLDNISSLDHSKSYVLNSVMSQL